MAWQKGSARLDNYMTGRGLSPRAAEGARRSTRPVYGTLTGGEPVTPGRGCGTTAALGQWSTGASPCLRGATEVFGRRHGLPTHWPGGLCRPEPRREPQPRAAFGGQARSLVALMCRPRPRTWVGAGPGQGKEDFDDKPKSGRRLELPEVRWGLPGSGVSVGWDMYDVHAVLVHHGAMGIECFFSFL